GPRVRPGWSLLLGGTPVLRLRTWQRALLSAPRRRLDGALPPAPRAGEGVRDPQPRAADAVFRRADRLRCDAAGAECRAHLRPALSPALPLGGRTAPQAHRRALARALPARESARHWVH